MNPGKRVHASVIVLLALTAWFLPVPDGLQDTQANRARLIARELNLAPDSVRLTVRLLVDRIDSDKLEEGIVDDIEEDEDPDYVSHYLGNALPENARRGKFSLTVEESADRACNGYGRSLLSRLSSLGTHIVPHGPA